MHFPSVRTILWFVVALAVSQKVASAQVQNNNAAWEMYATRLAEQIGRSGGDWTGVQIVTIPKTATWDNQQTGNYEAWVEWGDKMTQWGPVWTQTNEFFSQKYGFFIKSIQLPIPDATARRNAEAARRDWERASNTLQTAYEAVPVHWNVFNKNQQSLPPNRQLPYDQWYAQFDGRQIGGLQQNASAAALKYSSLIAAALKGFGLAADLIQNYENAAFRLQAPSPDGLTLTYRTYNISPSLGMWVATSKALPANSPPQLSFSFDKNTMRRTASQSWAGGSVSFGIGFLGISAGGRTSRESVDVNREGFSMSFEAKAIQQFSITPGQWYSGALVSRFANGPFVPGSVFDGQRVGGAQGALNLMPTSLVVAFRPKITARLSASEYHFLKESWSGGGGISLGPFSFGGGGGGTTETVTFTDSTNTVTAQGTSDVPQVIAVVYSRLP
jgi:hypothetical protein